MQDYEATNRWYLVKAPDSAQKGGLNDDTHPTCCCLHWISDLSPLRRQQDTQELRRGSAVCEIDQDAGQTLFKEELVVSLFWGDVQASVPRSRISKLDADDLLPT